MTCGVCLRPNTSFINLKSSFDSIVATVLDNTGGKNSTVLEAGKSEFLDPLVAILPSIV